MIRIKPEPKKTKTTRTHAPYAFTRKVIPEVMYRDSAPKKSVTKSISRAKLKPRNKPQKGGDLPHGQEKAPVPPPATEAGRPKVYATSADRQRAYRERKKGKA